MKSYFSFIVSFLSLITLAQNSLKINDLNAGVGNQATLTIGLNNTQEVAAFQFKVKFPSEVVVKNREAKLTSRSGDHALNSKYLGAGEYLFIAYSVSNQVFKLNSGSIIEIPIEIPLSYLSGQTYTVELKEPIVSSKEGTDIGSNHTNGTLKIIEGNTPDLLMESITLPSTNIIPNLEYSLDWKVKNIGNANAVGGWREEITLVSETTLKRYLISNEYYSSNLVENTSISRNATIKIPMIIGFDGNVKVEINIIPNTSLREPDSKRGNNKLLSNSTTLAKSIFLQVDKNSIQENSSDFVRLNLIRSGNTTNNETFVINSDVSNRFDLPKNLVLQSNQSSNFLLIYPINNLTYQGDQTINLIAKGNLYADVSSSINFVDDEKNILSFELPVSYNSNVGSKIAITLKSNFPTVKDQIIQLSSDKTERLKLPSSVTILKNQSSVVFEAEVLNNQKIEKENLVNILAKSENFTSGITELKLTPINIPDFTFTLNRSTINENEGVNSITATIERTTNTTQKSTLVLSSDSKDVILPSVLVFESGETIKKFSIGSVDNSEVDGVRTVNVFAKVQFEDCFCISDAIISSVKKQTITINDNDGLAINIKVNQPTLKAGINSSLIISRNTTDVNLLKNAVTVNLSNSLTSVLNLPLTATIPANQKEVVVNFNTLINPNLKGDQSIKIEATTTGYTKGVAWILVTDQNKSDIIITNIFTKTVAKAEEKINIKTTFKNQGNADFPSISKVEYFLSETNSVEGLIPFATSVMNQPILKDASTILDETVTLPKLSGKLNLIVRINPERSIQELDFNNNQKSFAIEISPSYLITLNVEKNLYKIGEEVKISGTTKDANNNPIANAVVSLKVKNQEFEFNYSVNSDANGNYLHLYKPLGNESGAYEVQANFPGDKNPTKKSFQILGFKLIQPTGYIKWEPLVGLPLEKSFTLENKTLTKLTNVKIQLPITADFSIEQLPIELNPGEIKEFKFKLISSKPSEEVKYYEHKIQLLSNEGAEFNQTIYYYSKNQEAKIIANPISINTTMVKDNVRLYEFTIQNVGAVDAENVEISIPTLDWMSLKSAEIIPIIKSNEIQKIVLELKPTVKEQVNVPLSGTIVINQKTGNSLTIPFRIENVSNIKGKLLVDATDEYTYNTASAPHLKGAKVLVKHPFTGAVIAEGITNDAGLFETPEISEGYYKVDVSADKHNPYQGTIYVDPGKTTKVVAFLSYDAITYSWDVKPIEIKDEYDVKLTVKFETNVPKPVIVMELDNNKLDLEVGQSRMSNLTITNHGLIVANDIKISVGTTYNGYVIEPLISEFEHLNPKSSIIVPILIKRTDGSGKRLKDNFGGETTECQVPINLRATYPCDGNKEIFSFTPMFDTCTKLSVNFDIINSIGTGSPGGGGSGTGTGTGVIVSTPSISASILDLCDPCNKALLGVTLDCGGILLSESPLGKVVDAVSCVSGFATSANFGDLAESTFNCVASFIPVVGKLNSYRQCITNAKNVVVECLINKKSNKVARLLPEGEFSELEYATNDLEKIIEGIDAQSNKKLEYFENNEVVSDSELFSVFLKEVSKKLDEEKPFTPEDVVTIKNNVKTFNISTAFIDKFTTRWNKTLEAWSKNIFSPNAQYSNIVDKVKVNQYNSTIIELNSYANERGFSSVSEMYLNFIQEFQKNTEERLKESSSSVCASVTLEFPQKLTMTREAFEGTLKINNSSDKNIKDIQLDVVITDELGVVKTQLFQINKEAFLNGSGMVAANTSSAGKAIFIPSKDAAPQTKQSYNFGGKFSYFDENLNERVYVTLNPVTLEVNPSPDLVLHYFMQRDILGDDALTEETIEPTIPAELGLLIHNDGFGLAKNVNVESMQPKIVENKKGLLIDFKMIGSSFNDNPKELGLLNVDFGSINPKTTSIGRWYFTSTLLGHFVSYDVKVNHVSNYGNANLSLIKASYIHELIKSVKAYDTGNDNLRDFLVNDISDGNDIPDRIYLSHDATSEEVSLAENIEIVEAVNRANLTSTIRIKPSKSGWNFGRIDNPLNGNYTITKIIRKRDNFEVPIDNFWQTHVTLRDGLNPKYENKLQVLDKISLIEDYILHLKPIDTNIPEVVSFVNPPAKNSAFAVESIQVQFNKEIDATTFTKDKIELIHQGNIIPSDKITITKVDAKNYTIGIKELTLNSGFYQLIVKTIGIKDLLGNEGKNGKAISWLQILGELGILKFESDQVKVKPINTVKVTFNKPIRTEEFKTDLIKINNANVNLTIQKIDEYNYLLGGINTYNTTSSEYKLTIDVTKINSTDGIKGLAIQEYTWKVDTSVPEILTTSLLKQSSVHNQHITGLTFSVNKELKQAIPSSSIKLFKNNTEVNIPLKITKINSKEYEISGFKDVVIENGTYKITINQEELIDENDNKGSGLKTIDWKVSLVNVPQVTDVKITPDKGILNSDRITSGNDVKLEYKTVQANQKVEIYELLASSERLLESKLRTLSGTYNLLISDLFGAKRFKIITYDVNNNPSEPVIINSFIDTGNIELEINPVKTSSAECIDFDYVEVKFAEEISNLPSDAIILKSNNKAISHNLEITKISDKLFELRNFINSNHEFMSIEIDKSKLTKKLSGLVGSGISSKDLGTPSVFDVEITGEIKPKINTSTTYKVSKTALKYDWIVVNGEVENISENSITIKWTKPEAQTLILRQVSPLGCASTKSLSVSVEDDNLSSEETDVMIKNNSSLVPNPNNGRFSIFTTKEIQNGELKIYNLMGIQVFHEKNVMIMNKSKEFTTNLKSGVYLVELSSDSEKYTFKVLVK